MDIERDSYTKGVALQLPSMVALDKDLRDASSDAEKQMDEFSVEMSMRKDIFDNIVAFSLTDDAKALDPELARFVEKSVIEGRRNGLHLPEDKSLEIKDIKKRISDLGVDFKSDSTHPPPMRAFLVPPAPVLAASYPRGRSCPTILAAAGA